MAINSNSIRADTFKEFYNLLKDNLATPGVKVTSAFVDDEAALPQVVIETPILPRIRDAMGDDEEAFNREGSIDIEIYTKTMKALIELTDDVENTLKNNLGSLSVQKVELGESTPAHFSLAGTNVHNIVVPVSFKLRLS